jgi:(1->4)-alpha-D-glucan 1-alpha-D-glucosylmutase
LSAPLAAKSVEDTAFYRYGPLLSRVDVGFDPGRFTSDVADFHCASMQRGKTHPGGLLATATHDHKRGEDVRARLAVLSEIPQEWTSKLRGWMDQSNNLPAAATLLPGDVAILLQMIVGAWPPDLKVEDARACRAFAERLSRWQTKALREAKLATDWAEPNETYEKTAHDLLQAVFANTALLVDIATFASRIAAPGAVNGLVQTVLKVTLPGVPDFYQGTEFWDLSLVDPDNRGPVDFVARAAALSLSDCHDTKTLTRTWRDGRIKQAVIARCLAARRAHAHLFASGEYVPLIPRGPAADHLIAYARRTESSIAVVAAVRYPARLLGSADTITVSPQIWNGTCLSFLEGNCSNARNVLTGSIFDLPNDLGCLFDELPVAIAICSERQS